MGRNEEQNKKIRDERREQILAAALKLFSRRGLGSTKVSEIAAEARVSHGLVYQYFSSKEEIFETLVEQAIELTRQAAEGVSSFPGTPMEKIQIFFHGFIEELKRQRAAGEYPYYFLIMIQATTFENVTEKASKAAYSSGNPLWKFIYDTIVDGQKQGEIIDRDPSMLTCLLMELITGMSLSNSPADERVVIPDVDLILRILKP